MAARCVSNRNASSLPQHARRSRAWPGAHTGTLTLSSEFLKVVAVFPGNVLPLKQVGV
jgi:hypothetical protein